MEAVKFSRRLYRQLPNCITVLRIIGTVCLLFAESFTAVFYVIYTLAGVSDALDGWLARRLKLSSALGAKLDSAADLTFYFVMFIRIFPVLWDTLPRVIWLGVALVVGLRLICYGYVAVRFHRFSAMHTRMNKLTGAAVFALPYLARTGAVTPYCWGLFGVSLLAALEELRIHVRAKEYAGKTE